MKLNTRLKIGIGLMILAVLVVITLALSGVDIVKSQLISSSNTGGAAVSVISITWNWLVVIPLALVFLAGLVCLAISFHANRSR
jgi:hypothetical protein